MVQADLDIPCLLVEPDESGCSRRNAAQQRVNVVDVTSWEDVDFNNEAAHYGALVVSSQADSVNSADKMEVSAITVEELLLAQENVSFCKQLRAKIDGRIASSFAEDERGLPVPVVPLHGVLLTVRPTSLRQKVLYLAHYTGTRGLRRCFPRSEGLSIGTPC